MNQQPDLRALEQRAWRSIHDDGFLDLFLGWLLLAGFLRSTTDQPYLSLLALLGVPIFWLGKRFITIPRVGIVNFGPRRRTHRKWLTVILSVSVLVVAAIYLLAVTGVPHVDEWPGMVNAAVTVAILGVFAALAWHFGLPRLLVIGLIFAATNVAPFFTDSPFIFLAGALVVIGIGIAMLVRFLLRYPIPHEQRGTP